MSHERFVFLCSLLIVDIREKMINCKALSWNLLFKKKSGCKQSVYLEHLLYPRWFPRWNTWVMSNLRTLGLDKLGFRSHSITFKLCGLRHKIQSSFRPSFSSLNNLAGLFWRFKKGCKSLISGDPDKSHLTR